MYKLIKSKISIILFISILLLSAAISFPVHAASGVGENSGTGQSSGDTSYFYSWGTSQQGYRFAIIDPLTGTVQSNVVDIVYSDPRAIAGNNITYLTSTRVGGNAQKYYLWDKIIENSKATAQKNANAKEISMPPAPIGWDNVKNQGIGQGDLFHSWMVGNSGNEGYMGHLLNLPIQEKDGSEHYLFQISNFTPSSTQSNAEYFKEHGYYLLVEPVFYFKPAAANPAYFCMEPISPYYVYGTANNFVEFYNWAIANLKYQTEDGLWYKSDYTIHMSQKTGLRQTGGAYTMLFGGIGWSCMMVDISWPFAGGDFKPANKSLVGTVRQLPELTARTNAREGIWSHIYSGDDSAISVAATSTWDDSGYYSI